MIASIELSSVVLILLFCLPEVTTFSFVQHCMPEVVAIHNHHVLCQHCMLARSMARYSLAAPPLRIIVEEGGAARL